MPLAVVKIKPAPHYRRDAFVTGLKKLGYKVTHTGARAAPGDVLVVWNRSGPTDFECDTWEKAGGMVLVVENGYIGKDEKGHQLYAIAQHGHNGSGLHPTGGAWRFEQLGIDVKPWRADGGHILVCGQRGIGSRLMASPHGWETKVARKLPGITNRRLVVRHHPGQSAPKTKLEADLAGAWACCIWSSSSGVKALVEGYPVTFDAPHWICEEAATRGFGSVKQPLLDDGARLRALTRMAWSQFRLSEIESGNALKVVIGGAA